MQMEVHVSDPEIPSTNTETFVCLFSGLLNETQENVNVTLGTLLCLDDRATAAADSNFSVWLLLAGIVLARFGRFYICQPGCHRLPNHAIQLSNVNTVNT